MSEKSHHNIIRNILLFFFKYSSLYSNFQLQIIFKKLVSISFYRRFLLFFSQICTQDCTQDCLIRNDFMRFQAVSNDKTKQSKIIKKVRNP